MREFLVSLGGGFIGVTMAMLIHEVATYEPSITERRNMCVLALDGVITPTDNWNVDGGGLMTCEIDGHVVATWEE